MDFSGELNDPVLSQIAEQGITVEVLNGECLCITLDRSALESQLRKVIDSVEVCSLPVTVRN
jgi:hypothetical protein